MDACMELDGYIYIGYQHGQAIQLLSVIMLHDLCVTVCVCSEGNAFFHINNVYIWSKHVYFNETPFYYKTPIL